LSLLPLQRYDIPIAVFEYFTRNFSFFSDIFSVAVIMVIMVICQNRKRMLSKPPLYINILYLYIVSNDRVSEIDFDHFDLDHFDHVKTLCAKVVIKE